MSWVSQDLISSKLCNCDTRRVRQVFISRAEVPGNAGSLLSSSNATIICNTKLMIPKTALRSVPKVLINILCFSWSPVLAFLLTISVLFLRGKFGLSIESL